MKTVKKLIIILTTFLLSACSNLKVGTTEWYLHKGLRYYRQNNTAVAKELLTEVINRNASIVQKELAYKGLAYIAFIEGDEDEAILLLNKSEKEANLLPYKYQVLATYYEGKKDFKKVKEYDKLEVNWIDKRIEEVQQGLFDVDILLGMNIELFPAYKGKREKESFVKIYEKKEPKELRQQYYINHLKSMKDYTLKNIEKYTETKE